MTAALSRRSLICSQAIPARVTGIDFVQVAAAQTELLIFFIVDPEKVLVDPGPPQEFMLDPAAALPLALNPPPVTVRPVGDAPPAPPVDGAEWDTHALPDSTTRTVLRLFFARAGGFGDYRLAVNHPAVDPLFRDVVFSFKQGCETGFDCEADCDCPPATADDVEIDYLARDFGSLNSALHDFARRRYPRWGEHFAADAGSMVIDLLAALGDEFAYTQDRIAREAFLESATQRRSLHHLTRLVDYIPDPGRNAAVRLSLTMYPSDDLTTGVTLEYDKANRPQRLTVFAATDGKPPVPFELGDPRSGDPSIFVHHHWNRMALHLIDPGAPCLKAGATTLYLAPGPGNRSLPLSAPQLPPSVTPEDAWVGRLMMLVTVPRDPSVAARAWPIRISSIEQLTDPLQATGGAPSQITRIDWDAAEALPFDLRIDETVLLGNVVPATAGATIEEFFRIGHDGTADPAIAVLASAVERGGILDETSCERPATVIYGLRGAEANGVSFTDDGPEIDLTEVSDLSDAPASTADWDYAASLLRADEDDRLYTLEPGTWRDIIRYHRFGETIVHSDYATGSGWSLRFGSGAFGRAPTRDSLFRVRYRTLAGTRSNLADGTIRVLDLPDGPARQPDLRFVASVVNPLPASGGRDPETPAEIRLRAPEWYRAYPLRAVRDEDYREILERLDWVQTAGARARWTGSWLSELVTADPAGAFAMSPDQLNILGNRADAIRQAGREIVVRQPRFLSVDVEITICVAPGYYGGQVREAVIAALAGDELAGGKPFFDPNRFTFGGPLRRSALEAAVQAVPGVLGVTRIRIRPRGSTGWHDFAVPEISAAAHELIRVENDPAFPEHGSIVVREAVSAATGGQP